MDWKPDLLGRGKPCGGSPESYTVKIQEKMQKNFIFLQQVLF